MRHLFFFFAISSHCSDQAACKERCILVKCGFFALVINQISIENDNIDFVFRGLPYEKIVSCNLLYGSRLRPHGLRQRQGPGWQRQSSGSGCYQGLIQFGPR
jgi:hypothetical protein